MKRGLGWTSNWNIWMLSSLSKYFLSSFILVLILALLSINECCTYLLHHTDKRKGAEGANCKCYGVTWSWQKWQTCGDCRWEKVTVKVCLRAKRNWSWGQSKKARKSLLYLVTKFGLQGWPWCPLVTTQPLPCSSSRVVNPSHSSATPWCIPCMIKREAS